MTDKSKNKSANISLENDISSGNINPVYVFTGDQVLLMEKALGDIKSSLLPGGDDMNYIIFHGDASKSKDIIDTASTYPMFASKKLIAVKGAEKLPAKELSHIDEYLESPAGFSCLVLLYGDGKKPKLKNKKNAAFIDFTLKKGNAISMVRSEAKSLGYDISAPAAQTLVSLVGEDLKNISNELMKITLYCGDRKRIEAEDVENLTIKTSHGDIFQLINAIGKRDKRSMHIALLDLEKRGEEPLSILSRITWRFRLIWRAKELIENKIPKAEMLRELKLSPGMFYYISEEQKKFSHGEIIKIMDALSQCDKKLKISYVPKSFVLTKLVAELCSNR